ncbi:MAG TPA: hypothetical protein PL033_13985 [Candidatus Brocadiia bacterium]|nr:hypothetical protein [Candidatus Brocadiia bacterium]
MKTSAILLSVLTLFTGLVVRAGMADELIGVPDALPTSVDAKGYLREDWGVAGVCLVKPEAASTTQEYHIQPSPRVITRAVAGQTSLTTTAYRAPVWPQSVDVLEARLANDSDAETVIEFRLDIPETVGIGERLGSAGGRAALSLPENPQPIRKMREWGCNGGAMAMPGWGRPDVECDAAFRNIRAGMGGVPIIYYLNVPAGASKTVVLGLCESHWADAGRRPVTLYVEGAPKSEVDAVASWGRHKPGCVVFNARDLNGDGRLQIVSAPHPEAQDKNPILNVIWVFSPDVFVDAKEVLKGNMNKAAERYVDVGGENDQLLYEAGALNYSLSLPAKSSRTLVFLLACAGGHVPNPAKSAWTPVSLQNAADDVWADFFSPGKEPMTDDAQSTQLRKELAAIVMNRIQADGYYVGMEQRGSLDTYSLPFAVRAAMKLEQVGHHADAGDMLRYLWDKPVPQPLQELTQKEDGQWRDAKGEPAAHILALQALTEHAIRSDDAEWAGRAWPAIKAGWDYLIGHKADFVADAELRKAAEAAKEGCAKVAEMAGAADDAKAIRSVQLEP